MTSPPKEKTSFLISLCNLITLGLLFSEFNNPNLLPSSLLLFTTLEKLNSKSLGIKNVASSLISFPEIASRVFATISTFFPIGPAVS